MSTEFPSEQSGVMGRARVQHYEHSLSFRLRATKQACALHFSSHAASRKAECSISAIRIVTSTVIVIDTIFACLTRDMPYAPPSRKTSSHNGFNVALQGDPRCLPLQILGSQR